MNCRNENTCKKDTPFPGYRFLVFFGIMVLTISIILLSVYFYIKYKEFLFLILASLICLVDSSHVACRIALKVVHNVYKKESNN